MQRESPAPGQSARFVMNRTLRCLVSWPAVLAACATPVPQVQQPQLVPESLVRHDAGADQIWPRANWWLEFGSPELANLNTRAQADNRNLAIAAARDNKTQKQTAKARAALFPQFTLQGQGHRTSLSRSEAGSGNLLVSDSFGLTLGASYEVDLWSFVYCFLCVVL